jgi:feruloyl esterase
VKALLFLAMLGASAGSAWADSSPCEGLTKLNLLHTQITQATVVEKGAFTPPPGGGGPPGQAPNPIFATLPSFCRVIATLRPAADSDIRIEVWMPVDGWNGRLEAVGNGGFSSNIQYNALAQAVVKGYAGTATNTGHDSNDSAFTIGHPERIKDWGYRSIHEMTVTAKAILAAHYGSGPKYSYWNSCSTGGRQGLVAAEYYPKDFDGLAVGDPANPMTRLQANSIAINLALNKDQASFIPQEKWAMIHQTVMNQCDAADGLKDGLIEDPMSCKFQVNSLLCKNGDAADCLTAPQIAALGQVVSGSKNPRTGAQLYPGYPLGTAMLPGPVAGVKPDGSAPDTFQMVFQGADWDYHAFDFDKDTARADKLGNPTINAVDETKLKALFAHGGKLLMYHGWNDPAITPLISIDYYNKAVAANGGKDKTYNSIRLFLVPGMNHCGGGEGPNVFDKTDVIADWVEHGKAPDEIIASHTNADHQVDRTRPLCPYPQLAKYKGSGSIDEAQNFVCAVP